MRLVASCFESIPMRLVASCSIIPMRLVASCFESIPMRIVASCFESMCMQHKCLSVTNARDMYSSHILSPLSYTPSARQFGAEGCECAGVPPFAIVAWNLFQLAHYMWQVCLGHYNMPWTQVFQVHVLITGLHDYTVKAHVFENRFDLMPLRIDAVWAFAE